MDESGSEYQDSSRVAELAARRLDRVDISATNDGVKAPALEYLQQHPEHATLIASELDKLINSYNGLEMGPDNTDRLQCTTKLKEVLPHLPLIGDIMSGKDKSASSMEWRIAFLNAIRTSVDRIARGSRLGADKNEEELMKLDEDPEVYVHHLFDTHPKAMLLAVAYHLYEDTVDRSPELAGKVPGKDTITNALIEVMIEKHMDSPLYQLTGNSASGQEDGGLDWIQGFEGFSDELLAKTNEEPV